MLLSTSVWATLRGLASGKPKHFFDHPKGKAGGKTVLSYISICKWEECWPPRLLYWVHIWCLAEAYGTVLLHKSMFLRQHEQSSLWLALMHGQANCRQEAQLPEELPPECSGSVHNGYFSGVLKGGPTTCKHVLCVEASWGMAADTITKLYHAVYWALIIKGDVQNSFQRSVWIVPFKIRLGIFQDT